MGLIEIPFIETTKWFPNKKDNLAVRKRHGKEYKVRLTWSNGGFPAFAPTVTRKNSGAGYELGMLSEIQSYVYKHIHLHVYIHIYICICCQGTKSCPKSDFDLKVINLKACVVVVLRVHVASSSHRSERSFRLRTFSSNTSSFFGGRLNPDIISHNLG